MAADDDDAATCISRGSRSGTHLTDALSLATVTPCYRGERAVLRCRPQCLTPPPGRKSRQSHGRRNEHDARSTAQIARPSAGAALRPERTRPQRTGHGRHPDFSSESAPGPFTPVVRRHTRNGSSRYGPSIDHLSRAMGAPLTSARSFRSASCSPSTQRPSQGRHPLEVLILRVVWMDGCRRGQREESPTDHSLAHVVAEEVLLLSR